MHGQARSKSSTKDWDTGYSKINWSDQPASDRAHRAVKVGSGGYDCGLKSHDHSTFAEAAACVTGKGK